MQHVTDYSLTAAAATTTITTKKRNLSYQMQKWQIYKLWPAIELKNLSPIDLITPTEALEYL